MTRANLETNFRNKEKELKEKKLHELHELKEKKLHELKELESI